MTIENLKIHHARLKWLASGDFKERDFDFEIDSTDNPNGEKGEKGWTTMGEMKPARKELIQQDAQRHLALFEKKYLIPEYTPRPKSQPSTVLKPETKPAVAKPTPETKSVVKK